jgi:hypothetical protein
MAKKYAALVKKLPAFGEEPTYQSLVDEKKQELLGTLDGEDANINRLAALFVKYERDKKSLYERYQSKEKTDAEYEINLYKTALSQLFVSACLAGGAEEIRLSTDELVALDYKPILTIVDKPKAIEWALENVPELLTISYKGLNRKQIDALAEWGKKKGLEIEVNINANTLKSMSCDNADKGKPVPDGMKLFGLMQAKVYGLNRGNGDDE